MAWAGIIGKSFAAPEQFSSYFDTITFGAWRPRFVVVHNTSAPDLQTYANWQTRHPPVTDEQWAACSRVMGLDPALRADHDAADSAIVVWGMAQPDRPFTSNWVDIQPCIITC